MKRFFTLIMLSILACGYAMAYDFSAMCSSGQTLYYNITSDVAPYTVEVVSENNGFYTTEPTGDLVIPETVEYNSITYSVTGIGDTAFENCRGLTSVTIPNSVTYIRLSAFMSCEGLTSVTIGNSVESIGNNAFYSCIGLTSITIPSSVTSIEELAFSSCSRLEFIVVESGNSTYDSRDNCNAIIETSTNKLISGCANTIIPNLVTGIGNYAFQGIIGLTSISIPNSVTSIGESAFQSCDNMTEITIPNSVTEIGSNAFFGCSGLTSLTIPNSVTEIGESAFSACFGLTTVNFNATNCTSMGSSVWENSPFTTLNIGENVTNIPSGAFANCSNISVINISASTPPNLDASTFFSTVYSTATLNVPCGAKDAYENANEWSNFQNIRQNCETPTVTTLPCEDIESHSVTLNAAISGHENVTILDVGFIYATSTAALESLQQQLMINATVNEGYIIGTLVDDEFTADVYGLSSNTDYYYLAFVRYSDTEEHILFDDTPNSFRTTDGSTSNSLMQSGDYNNHGYVDLGLSVKWATTNLGATNPEDYGNYYAWGETTPKATYSWMTYQHCLEDEYLLTKYCFDVSHGADGFTDGLNTLEAVDDAATANWGVGWRMPTRSEMEELRNSCTWEWTSQNGIDGYIARNESTGYSMFLPAAGYLDESGEHSITYDGDYWTSSLSADNTVNAYSILFYDGTQQLSSNMERDYGLPIRAVYDATLATPRVTTKASDNVTETTAILQGSYNNDIEIPEAFSFGFLYGTDTTATLTEVSATYDDYTTYYIAEITGLSSGTTYYFKFFAENSNGRGYGQFWEFQTGGNIVNWITIGGGPGNNTNLPVNIYYKYSLSQQIYTPAEIGRAGTIERIAFYNNTDNIARTIDLYMFTSDRQSFTSTTDWETVSSSDRVFSGEVTFLSGEWTVIPLTTPFEYDGVSNIIVVTDDNTAYDATTQRFLTFEASGQSIYVNGDDTDFDPTDLSGTTAIGLEDVKNQIKLGFTSTNPTFEYVDLGLPSGTKWATMNIGAERPEDFGTYFAWGETSPKTVYDWESYIYADGDSDSDPQLTKYCNDSGLGITDALTELETGDDAATAILGSNWRMPTYDEVIELRDYCEHVFTTQNGVAGTLVTGPNNQSIFIPAAAGRYYNNLILSEGTGSYWSSSLDTDNPSNAQGLSLGSNSFATITSPRYFGLPIRPVYDPSQTAGNFTPAGLEDYEFTTGTDGTAYSPSLTQLIQSGQDDQASELTAIGFTFTYDEVEYTQFSVNSNGRLRLGNEVITDAYNNPFTQDNYDQNTPAIVGVGRDLSTGADGYVSTGLYGSSGSYIRVVEFLLATTSTTTSDEYIKFQVQLFEATGEVRIVYSDYENAPTAYQIGIGNADATKFWYVDPNSHTAAYATESTETSYSGHPGIGRYYSFAPPVRNNNSNTTDHEYVDLGLPSGTLWATMNIGAETPEDFGSYFAWGETSPMSSYNLESYTYANGYSEDDPQLTKYCNNASLGYNGYTDELTTLEAPDDAATANWGSNWRMPTYAEVVELRDYCQHEFTTQNGVSGTLVTGPNNRSIFIPAAGGRVWESSTDEGEGSYWANSLSTSSPIDAQGFHFEDNSTYAFTAHSARRYYGYPIRPVYATSQTANNQIGSFTDTRDGRTYDYVVIGDQTWMAENLRYDNSGSMLVALSGETSTTDQYLYYPNGLSENLETYGYLYNWPAAMNGESSSDTNPSGVQGICPEGWHLPSNAEWTQLYQALGGETNAGAMLSGNASLWSNPTITESQYFGNSGFNALPAGYYESNDYGNFGNKAFFWSASEYDTESAYICYIGGEEVGNMGYGESAGLSVRCVKDAETVADGPSDPTGTHNNHGYVDLGLQSGTMWATVNVGANTPSDYGKYYSWGEVTFPSSYESYDWSEYDLCDNGSSANINKYCTVGDYGTVDNLTTLSLSDDAASDNWGGEWRMPTSAEYQELIDNCTWEWSEQDGKEGYLVRGDNGNSIFLPAAGYLDSSGEHSIGYDGNYWSSSLREEYPSYAWSILFYSGSKEMFYQHERPEGLAIRPVYAPSNTANNPTNTGEIIYQCDFENGSEDNWPEFNNGSETNHWTIGFGTSDSYSTETNCLYITNDGSSYNYNNGAASTVYAYKQITLPSRTNYHILFDWKCTGENNYDFLRAFLIPTSENPDLSAGNSLGDGYENANNTPDGWIDLSYGQMASSDNQWQQTDRTMALSGGNYYLVFYWHNDGSAGSNPPAAVDNIFFYKLKPISVTANNVTDKTSTSATLNGTITFIDDPEDIPAGFKWGLSETSLLNNATTQSTGATFSAQLTGLTAQTTYYYQAYAVYEGDTAFSEIAEFRTALDESAAGGANNPLIIGDINDWNDFSNALQNPSTVTYKGVMLADYGEDIYFSLESDLSFTDGGTTFNIQEFRGNLNGNYNTITIQPYQTFTGLFANLRYGHIDNLNLKLNSSASLEGAGDFGMLCQNAYQAYISNCTVSGVSSAEELSSSDETHVVGGLVGYATQTTISGCTNNLKITSDVARVGGIAGKADGIIGYCTNNAELRGAYVGGIVAQSAATITDCLNTGLINCADEYAGGISGIGGTIVGCMNIGEISTSRTQKAGGIVGNAGSATVTNCANYGVFTSLSSPMGGIAGTGYGSGTYSHNVSAPIFRGDEAPSVDLQTEIYATVGGSTGDETDDFFDEQLGDIKVDSLRLRFIERGTRKTSNEMVGSALSGSLSSEYWDFTEGVYPKPKNITETPQTLAARIPIYLSTHEYYGRQQSVFGVWSDFMLPTTIDGQTVTWESSNTDRISISNGSATVNRPTSTDVSVMLTASYQGYSKWFAVTVIGPKQIPVNTDDAWQDSVISLNASFSDDLEGITYVYDYGFEYSTTSADLSEGVTQVHSNNLHYEASAGFSYPLANIPEGTTVYFRAYATTVDGTEYGEIMSVKALGAPAVVAKYPMWRTDNDATIDLDITLNEGEYDDFYQFENRNVYYGTERNRLILSEYIDYESDYHHFSVNLHDLAAETKYYYVAEVTNDYGTTRSDTLEFITCGTMTDSRDNTQYYTIQIGNQTWMAQNLKFDGVTAGTDTSSFVAYRYNPDDFDGYVEDYGYLYNWTAILNGGNSSTENPSGVQGICPNGWHLPSDAEWTQLTEYLGGGDEVAAMLSGHPASEGQYWEITDMTESVNFGKSGFNAMPTGVYYAGYYEFGKQTAFWSVTESDDIHIYSRYIMGYGEGSISRSENEGPNGYAVRCIKGTAVYAYDTINPCMEQPYSYTYHDTVITTDGDYTIREQIDSDTENIYKLHIAFHPTLTATINDFSNGCFGANNGYVEVGATGGAGDYSYAWSTPEMQTTARLSNLTDGGYSVTVTDVTGCTASVSQTIVTPGQLTVTISGDNQICEGDNASLTATAEGGTPDYSYAWTNGATNESTNVQTAGTYAVTVTDDASCTATAAIVVTVNPAATLELTSGQQNQTLCYGTNFTTTVFTYGGGANGVDVTGLPNGVSFTTDATNHTVEISGTPTEAGSYTYMVTTTGATSPCTNMTITGTIIVQMQLTATISGNNPDCYGDETTLTASLAEGTPNTYAWSSGETSASITVSPTTTTTYTVTITDANNCTATALKNIVVNSQLTVSISGDTQVQCFGDNTATLTASASGGSMATGYTYNWSNSLEGQTISTLGAGNYIVTVTDANLCTAEAEVEITEPTAITISVVSTSPQICTTLGSIEVSATGGTGALSFAWSTTAHEATYSGLTAGFYTVTVTDENNCTATRIVEVEDHSVIPDVDITNNTGATVITCAVTEISLTAEGNGDFVWDDGSTEAGRTVSTLGTYSVTITDANGCANSTSIDIDQSNENPTVVLADDDITICAGTSTTVEVASVTGGVAPYQYSWNGGTYGGDTEYTASNVTANTTITLTVKDANGCTGTASAEISLNDRPTAVISGGEAICNGDEATFTIAFTGAPTYNYTWSDGTDTHNGSTNESSVTINVTPTATTTYTLVSLSDDNCTSTGGDLTGSVEVIVNEIPYATAVTTDNEMCAAPFSGIITVSTFGPEDTDYTVTLVGNSSQTVSQDGTAVFTSLEAGDYTVEVSYTMNSHTCTETYPVTIGDELTYPTVEVTAYNNGCSGENNGTIEIHADGGTPDYTYAWTNADDNPVSCDANGNLSELSTGTYTVTVTDAHGCATSTSQTITSPATALSASISGPTEVCNNTTATLTVNADGGTAPYTYAWDDDNTNPTTAESITTPVLTSDNTPFTYTVTVTDVNGCTFEASHTVTIGDTPSLTLDSNAPICDGEELNLSATVTNAGDSYTIEWTSASTDAGLPNPANTDQIIVTPASPGTYTYTATLTTDVCEAGTDYLVSDDITITVYPKPEVAITTTSQQICPNATIDLDAELTENGTAEYTYTWSATDGITLAETDDITTSETTTTNTATAPAANIATCGTQYIISLHVEDTNGCTADASPITITVGDEINPTIGDDNLNRQLTSTNCTFIVPDLTGEVRNIASDNCTANGNLTVSQNITAGTEITTATTVVVTVTDQCGNNSTKEIELTLPEELTTSLSSNPATIACNGGTTSITNTPDGGAAPYLYFWSNSTNEQNLADVSAGTYTVTVRDNNGCSVVESIEITQPNALTASLSATEIPCHGVTSTITNTVGGGTTPYAYAWETGETSQNLTGVSGGTYSVTVTDANGCTASATITIIEPAELTSSLSAGEIGCNGGIANITNTVNGGTEPITYEWSNGNNTQGLTGVGAGEYTVTVRDNNGCSVVQSATISQPDALTASLTAGTINCNGETTDITSAVNGGTQNYSYAWSNGETTNNLTGVGAGNYSVTVSDANSCTASAITTVSAPDVLTVSISGSTSVCENTTSTLTANVQGGTTDYTYLWSYNNSTTVSITTPQLTTATEYSVTVTDANNCSATAGVTVVIGDTPGISIAEVQAICVGGNTILQANIYNAGDNYTVEWTSTDANAGLPADVTTDAITVTPTTAGAYTYTASLTATSCSDGQPFTSSEDVTLTVNALPDAAITNNTNETTITCNTTQISLTATGGNTYAWSNGVANADNNIATADTYIVTVTDVNGCSNTASETISEDVTAPIVSIANNTGTTLLTCTTTTINVEATGDDATYLWSNGETTATTAITTGGTYTVTATADNGCTSTAAIEITPNADAPTVSITNNSDTTVLTCSLTSINVTATGSGTSYEWSNGANTAENTLTAPGTYTVTATAGNGCSASDQITITQNIEAPEIIASAAATAICQGGSTTISATGGQSYTWSPETELQTTVGSSITVTPTETRTYTVTGVGTNGCTGTAEVTVTVNMPTSSAFTETACDSYDWNSTTYTESGDYVQTLQTVNGCDSVVTLHLTIYNSQTEFVEVTACDSYEWAGETYTVSGNYEHTFTAVNGCDSVVTLRLTINNSQTNMVEVTACESYEWNSNIYTETGDYEQTFQTTEGCDSVVTLHLTISSTITNEISDTACDSFQWNDTTYYASGEYIQTFYTREGCDSVVTLNLTINYSTEITDTVVVCDSFEWEGQTYTESGEYEKAYTTINGCDSIRRLHLTINQSLTESVEVTACESYQWNDSIYYASGDYEQTFQSVSGCDSVVTLHLTINSSTTNEISAQMCSGVPYTYEGETFTEAGTYTVTLTNSVGCDSIVTLTITYASNCGGIVSGIITDENSGEPIYNARVTVGNKVTRTNAEGEYSIEVLRGRKTFRVSANGYISHSRSVDIQSDTVFNISLNAPHIETDVDSLTVSSYPYLEQSDSITLSNTGSGTLVWSSITEYDNLALVEDSVIQQRRNTRSLWDSIQTFATRENAEQAIATDGFFIYTSSWMRPGEFNRYTPNGEYVETFYVENVGSIRNLSYDGTHFYGTEGTNIIFKLDLDNQTLVDSIETDIQEIRHCSFNKQDGSLLAGSWNSLYRIDIENGTSEPIRNDLANVYSSAFDNLSPGGPYLWLFSQTSQNNGPSAYIRQFNISTGEYTDRTHYLDDINLSSSSLAGGICASEYVCEGKFVLLADVQNPMGSNTIATYEIGRTNNVVRTGKKSGSIAPNSSENISVKASATETGDYSATIKYRAAVMGTYSRDIDVNISAVAPECDAVQQISIVTDTFHTVTLDWQPVELGNYESVSYLVFNTASQYAIDTVSGTTVTYDGLPVGEHCFSVRALSQAGYTCLSAASDTVCAEIQDIPCNVPLAVEARSDGESITISWNMPVGVDYVSLYRNSDPIDEHLTTTSYIDTNVVPETDYCYIVIAHFENGVCDEISGNACIRIASDVCTEAPVLTADAVNGTVALEWTESNGAVNYRVFRNDTFIGATNGNTYIDNVTESDEYCYRVESICEYGMFASSDEVCISVDTTEDDGSGSGEGSGEGEGDAIDEWTADNLTLYPNPTYGQFFIEGQRIAVVQIFNASGMLVTEIENTEDERITINCEGWNPGLYNIRIISTEGETATRKVTIFR